MHLSAPSSVCWFYRTRRAQVPHIRARALGQILMGNLRGGITDKMRTAEGRTFGWTTKQMKCPMSSDPNMKTDFKQRLPRTSANTEVHPKSPRRKTYIFSLPLENGNLMSLKCDYPTRELRRRPCAPETGTEGWIQGAVKASPPHPGLSLQEETHQGQTQTLSLPRKYQ